MKAKRVRLDAVCAAAVALVAARVWLVLAPGQAVRWGSRIAERNPRPVENPRAPLPDARIRDLSRAVIAVGARPPLSATCLEQSLALVMLLALARIPAHLLVGVARLESSVRAHAWVECGGQVVLGGARAAAFVPLLGRSAASAPSVVVSSCPG